VPFFLEIRSIDDAERNGSMIGMVAVLNQLKSMKGYCFAPFWPRPAMAVVTGGEYMADGPVGDVDVPAPVMWSAQARICEVLPQLDTPSKVHRAGYR
jgi:hypothetical protein